MSYGNNRPGEPDNYPGVGRLPLVLFGLFFAACMIFICGGVLVGLVGHLGKVTDVDGETLNPWVNRSTAHTKVKRPGTFTVLDWKTEFTSPAAPADEADLAGIERLFDTLLAATEKGNKAGIRDCFDDDRRFEEIAASRLWPSMTQQRIAEYKIAMPADRVMPPLTSRYKIVSVRPTARPNEVVVSGYFWYTHEDCSAVQFRLIRRGRWRVFDVAECGYEMTRAERDAMFMLVQMEEGPAKQELVLANNALDEVERLLAQHNRAGAMAKLRLIQFSKLRSDLADDLRILVAFDWMQCQDAGQVIAAAESVQNKEKNAYAHYLLAWGYASQGKHDKVVEACEAFAKTQSETIRVAFLLAAAYEALERPADAARVWTTVLRADPEHISTLAGLARNLDENSLADLSSHLKSLPSPIKTCESLLAQSFRLGDSGARELLAGLIAELAPGSAVAERAKGRVAQHLGEYEEAAACFSRAAGLEEDPETKREMASEYVSAMIEAEQYLKAYTEGPDPDAAFEYLIEMQGDEDSVEIDRPTWDALLAARREKHPDDPRAYLLAGRLLAEDEDYAAAEREFAAGLAKTEDEDLQGQLQREREMALAHLGRATEAYLASQDPAASFLSLAGQLQSQNKDDELAKLIELHRAKSPADSWLDLYAGQLCARRKDWPGAEHYFVRGERGAKEEWLKSSYRRERTRALIDAHGIAEAYRRLGGNSSVFVEMVQSLRYRNEDTQLAQLVAAHRLAMPRDRNLLYWEAELLRRRKDDEGYLRVTQSIPAATWGALEEHQRRDIAINSVRALLRQNRKTEAVARARSPQFSNDPFPALLAEAAAGNVTEATRLLREHNQQPYRFMDPYREPDLGSILRSAPFLPLREEVPPALSNFDGSASIVLLLESPGHLSAEQLRGWLPENVRGTAQIDPLPALESGDDSAAAETWVARCGEFVACVSRGTRKYAANAEKNLPRQADEELKQIVLRHGGWVQVSVDAPFGKDATSSDAVAGKLAAAIARAEGKNGQAIYWARRFQLLRCDPAGQAQLLSGTPPQAGLDEEDGHTSWFVERGPRHNTAYYRQTQRMAREFRAAWAKRRPGEQFAVQVELSLGEGVERIWLNVMRRQTSTYGTGQLQARMISHSLLRPELKTGEPVVLYDTQLIDWRAQ